MTRAGHPSRVVVRKNGPGAKQTGLLLDSVVMADNLATIHDSEIDQVIGAMADMLEVDAALRTTLAV